MDRAVAASGTREHALAALAGLTPREREVVVRIVNRTQIALLAHDADLV